MIIHFEKKEKRKQAAVKMLKKTQQPWTVIRENER